jgi:hypothetical protein
MSRSDENTGLHMINGEESLAVGQELPPERLSPGAAEPIAGEHVLSVSTLIEQCRREVQAFRYEEPCEEAYSLELLRRAIVQGDQEARAGLQHCLSELVQGWLYNHPHREAALSFESEESYVALAFERLWQATVRQQVAFRTLAGALAYLRASLHGAILDMLRTYSWPGEVSLPESHGEDRAASLQAWEVLQSMLPNAREQRLAYLLYHCGLEPREIVRFCPQEGNPCMSEGSTKAIADTQSSQGQAEPSSGPARKTPTILPLKPPAKGLLRVFTSLRQRNYRLYWWRLSRTMVYVDGNSKLANIGYPNWLRMLRILANL